MTGGNMARKTGKVGKTVTKEKLLLSALDLFYQRWYETVSVAEICRNANLSNGIFYKYFDNKEDIFKELLDRYLARFSDSFNEIKGDTIEKKLVNMLTLLLEDQENIYKLANVYREGQYRFPRYEKKLRDFCMQVLSDIYNREISEAEYVYTISGVRFLSMRALNLDNIEVNRNVLKKILLKGIFTEEIQHTDKLFKEEIKPLDNPDDNSRNRLLQAGMKLFGKDGYYNVNVYDIAKEAGFSVGTFYLYYPTKEDFLSEIVHSIGASTRHFITINLDKNLNRVEQELQGLYLFLIFFSERKNYYRIVREAEFVVNQAVTEYYDKFEQGYLKNLRNIKLNDTRIVANVLMGISHYFGIETIFSKNIDDERGVILRLGELMCNGMPV